MRAHTEHLEDGIFVTNASSWANEEIPHYAFKILSTVEGVCLTLALFLNGLVILVTFMSMVRHLPIFNSYWKILFQCALLKRYAFLYL